MDGYSVFVLLLAGYIVLLVATGVYFNKRQTSLREFMLAGRRAGPLALGFSAAASWLTAGALLAVIGFFMLLGMGSIWGFVAPNILALLIIALLVKKIRRVPAMTQPELLELRYGSFLRLPVSLIIIVVMILFTVADIKGFAMVLQVFYSIDKLQAAMIVGLAVAVYVTLGGLAAVIATDTLQYLLLATFVGVMAVLVMHGAGDIADLGPAQLVRSVDGSWWNPLVIGMPMVLIFSVSIIPGWITEQDPWQKIWAARSDKAARSGMVIGSLLVTVVFGGCALIGLGLLKIYPEIGEMGFPMGMAKAEPALLTFIMGQGYGEVWLAVCAVALAAAAMSCADTFAASGASCVARDLYQRHINPAASMREMLTVNRLAVLFIIAAATAGSLFIESIIEAIHVATFIASGSYFFALMGGMYWRRGTAEGAAASMVVGFVAQCSLIMVDKMMTGPGAPPYLETVHPALMGHGVIAAMAASGLVYVVISLVTAPVALGRLAPFFADKAHLLAATAPSPEDHTGDLEEPLIEESGDRIYMRQNLQLPQGMSWRELVGAMTAAHGHWLALGGHDSIRRCSEADFLSCVTLTCGETRSDGWLEVEGTEKTIEELRQEVAIAYHEVKRCIENLVHAEPEVQFAKIR